VNIQGEVTAALWSPDEVVVVVVVVAGEAAAAAEVEEEPESDILQKGKKMKEFVLCLFSLFSFPLFPLWLRIPPLILSLLNLHHFFLLLSSLVSTFMSLPICTSLFQRNQQQTLLL